MADVYGNFAYCSLTSAITSATTVLPVDTTQRIPDPVLGEVWLTFDSTLSAGEFEIVRVVSKTVSTLTVLRAQEGTLAQATSASATVLRGSLTAAMLERLRPRREVATFTTALLASGAREQGLVTLARSYRLMRILTNAQCRVRLYDRAAKQTADATRELAVDPGIDSGVTFEFIAATGALGAGLSPLVDGTDWDLTPTRSVPITVDNLEGDPRSVVVALTFLRTEP